MFAISRKPSRILAVALATGSLGAAVIATPASARAVASPGAASLSQGANPAPSYQASSSDPIYVLSPDELASVCGDFGGTIVYSDGYAVDCSTGEVYFNQ